MTALFSVMRDAGDPKNRDAWKKMLASRGKRDLYVIREPERAELRAGHDPRAERPTGTKLELREGGRHEDDAPASRGDRRARVRPAAPAQEVPPTLCKVIDVFGNTLDRAVGASSAPSGVTVTTVAGVAVKYPSTASLAKLDYSQGNVAYLSDLDPQRRRARRRRRTRRDCG